MTTDRTDNPAEANTTPAGKVQFRDHVVLTNRSAIVYKVEHSFRYTDAGSNNDMVLLTLTPIGGGTPLVERCSVEAPMQMATEDQVAAAVDAMYRKGVAEGLHRLADLIVEHKVRFRSYGGANLSIRLPDGEVSRVADALGLELRDSYGASADQRAEWSSPVSDGPGVEATFYGLPAAAPQPADDELAADVKAVLADAGLNLDEGKPPVDQATEHRQASGWNDGFTSGSAGVSCVCGVTFDGFDTIGEAREPLRQHIADMTAAPTTQAGE